MTTSGKGSRHVVEEAVRRARAAAARGGIPEVVRAGRRELARSVQSRRALPAPDAAANPLTEYFRHNDRRLIHKWVHYFDIYHRHFARFRDTPCVVVEFGVAHGGSLQMWRSYFGKDALIFGIDVNPECKTLEEPGTRVFIGDQEDRAFLAKISAEIGPIDVLIEDGGHKVGQQIATFDVMYPTLSERGVFLIEDLHTNYWPEYGGAYRNPGTFIEHAKNHIDQLNAWHSRDPELEVNEFTRTTASMHFYDSIVVFERAPVVAPHHEKTGNRTLPNFG